MNGADERVGLGWGEDGVVVGVVVWVRGWWWSGGGGGWVGGNMDGN